MVPVGRATTGIDQQPLHDDTAFTTDRDQGASTVSKTLRNIPQGEGGGTCQPSGSTQEPTNPFRRKDRLRRTPTKDSATTERNPPGDRAPTPGPTSKPSEWRISPFLGAIPLRRSSSVGSGKKRKVEHSAIDDPESPRKESVIALTIIHSIENMSSLMRQLEASIAASNNTKKDIKEIAERMRREIRTLNRDKVSEWLQENKYVRKESPTSTTNPTATHDKGTQIGNNLGSLDGVHDLEGYYQVKDREWEDATYTNTEVRVGNPIDSASSVTKVVLVEPDDINMDRSIQRLYRDRFPELADIAADYEVLEHEVRTRMKESQAHAASCNKIIKACHKGTDNDIWNRLQMIKKDTDGDEVIALHHLRAKGLVEFRKMVECIFHSGTTRVLIYTTAPRKPIRPGNNLGLATEDPPPQPKAWSEVAGASRPARKQRLPRARRKNDVVVVRPIEEGQTFDSILKSLKETLPASEVNLTSIRQARNGDLLLGTKDDSEALRQKVSDALGNRASAHRVTTDVTIQIRGIDTLTTAPEVADAINRELTTEQVSPNSITLRPFRHSSLTAVVRLQAPCARRLVNLSKIKIGWLNCTIRELGPKSHCFRCWGDGHVVAQCKGQDRRLSCYRCGAEGHRAAVCRKPPHCLLCEDQGREANHQARTNRCPSKSIPPVAHGLQGAPDKPEQSQGSSGSHGAEGSGAPGRPSPGKRTE